MMYVAWNFGGLDLPSKWTFGLPTGHIVEYHTDDELHWSLGPRLPSSLGPRLREGHLFLHGIIASTYESLHGTKCNISVRCLCVFIRVKLPLNPREQRRWDGWLQWSRQFSFSWPIFQSLSQFSNKSSAIRRTCSIAPNRDLLSVWCDARWYLYRIYFSASKGALMIEGWVRVFAGKTE